MIQRVVSAVMIGLAVVRVAGAQDTTRPMQLADRGPRFLYGPTHGEVPADARGAMVLKRTIAVSATNATIAEVLAEIGKAAGVRIVYKTDVLPAGATVSIEAGRITVGAALTDVLQDVPVDVELTGTGILTLVPRERGSSESGQTRLVAIGSIVGVVTDSATGANVPYAVVRIDETGQVANAGSEGRYALAGVAPGSYHVTARRVGFIARTRPVVVEEGVTATLNFVLNQPPTKLDEVVTTAVGDQRRYEVGNSIATINIDSIAPTAPVTSLTDLISARAPGVEVLENSGITGSGETIRIRGLSSLVLQNDPILIVDGVRQDNSAGGDVTSALQLAGTSHPTPTRLNDLDFADIETVDILKGPAASTEYGTDAANGVIVITTRRGAAGGPQWRISAEQTESDLPTTFPNNYYSWGHTTNGTDTPVNCPLAGGLRTGLNGLSGYTSTAGTCAVDSVTQWNPLNHKATTIFGTGDRGKYDLSVGGGSDAIRYYVSGGLTNETGLVTMPPVFKQLADSINLGLPGAAFNSNTEQQRSVRANTAIRLGATADLSATGSYLATYQQTPEVARLYFGALTAPALSDAAHYYGYETFGSSPAYTPLGELSQIGSQNTDRVTGGVTGTWRPAGWFVGHATVGLDHGSQREQELGYPLANPQYSAFSYEELGNVTTDVYSVDLRGTATASITHSVRAVTSVGLQEVDTRIAGQTATVLNISSTNLTLNGYSGAGNTEIATRQATLGGYGEERLGFADRLFLTGALRVDAASGFGSAYSTAVYPKASLSWLAVNGGSTTLRVRGAFGESGVQPMNGAALLLYAPNVTYVGGSATGTAVPSWPGNPNLRPERSAEFEGGVDFGAWGNRLSLEVTGYQKTTHDALVNVNLGATLGSYTYQENIGEVRNTGVEGTLTVGLVQSRAVSLDVVVNASVNHNTLLSLAPGVVAQTVLGYDVQYRQAPGFPLYGIWSQTVTYADLNHDGIIEPNEVKVADSASYLGSSLPTQEASVSTHLALLGGAVAIGALVDYRGGYQIANETYAYADYVGNTRGANDPHAPLSQQARAVVNRTFDFNNSLNVSDGSFVRFRELSLTYTVPHSLVRALRVQTLSVTGAVRNLALWTRYAGVDPEASNSGGSNVQFSPTSNGNVVNNDVREDLGAVPLARYWVLRLNVGL
jgi:TonB-linked SusC/RagA family outer membrane protein